MMNKLRVGVGVITAGIREIQPYMLQSEYHDIVWTKKVDVGFKGPAFMRNQVLRELYDQGCDIIINCDDDVYPIKKGWIDYIAQQFLEGENHYLGIPDIFNSKLLRVEGEIAYWDACIGAFSVASRQLIETVGGYNTAYDRYGYEDCGWLYRVMRSGLIQNPGYPSPIRLSSYVKSEDVMDDVKQHNMSKEEKAVYIAKNNPIFHQEAESSQLFYPF